MVCAPLRDGKQPHDSTIRNARRQTLFTRKSEKEAVGARDHKARLEQDMAKQTYDRELTALLVIDPYNDFISEGGKLWDRIRAVAQANDCIAHMLQVLEAARKAKLRVFYALHHRYRPGDYETWKYIAPVQKGAWARKTFEFGTWGGEIRAEFAPKPGEIVAEEHWCSSGFANTDLDLLLKKHGIHRLIVIGLIAHTCVEATVRFAAELGYDVTVVRDATADYSDEHMHAALDINLPNYASAVVGTEEIVASIAALGDHDGHAARADARAGAAT
jgi:nicotinamidase-related amidase